MILNLTTGERESILSNIKENQHLPQGPHVRRCFLSWNLTKMSSDREEFIFISILLLTSFVYNSFNVSTLEDYYFDNVSPK